MAEESEQDKTELATPYKLERARKKGVVARGVDLGFLTGLAALLGYSAIVGPGLGAAMARAARDAWVMGPALTDDPFALLSFAASVSYLVLRPLALLSALIFAVVLLFELVQTGFVFSAEPLAPDFSRLSPSNGFKRVFSLRAFIEILKNIAKFFIYTALAVLIVRLVLRSDIASLSDGRALLAHLSSSGLRMLSVFFLGAILFAVIDQLIVRGTFSKRMRMTRRELRREARDREGDPRLKQRRRQLHREFTKARQSLRNLRNADVVVTNPQHIAVALQYEPRTMLAPKIVAVGTDHLAQRLRRLAFFYNIPTVENRPLAQALYYKASLNSTIPDTCFKAVADVYNFIRARARMQEQSDV